MLVITDVGILLVTVWFFIIFSFSDDVFFPNLFKLLVWERDDRFKVEIVRLVVLVEFVL